MTTPNTEPPVDETEASDTESPAPEVEREPDSPATEAEEPETFPRSYVEELRQENGRYRQRAQQADQYAQRLHTELVRATGRLADPTDLPFNADHLDDQDSLTAAIDELLVRKPHLVNRRPTGDIGQGATPPGGTVDLAAILRQQAQ
ncbi:hypothetical protein MML61_22505 [Mycobacterium marinum]|uniref:hypothetical protein n=1 Tax=Mycobacterium marinum TaxID=1781 RepID=UPI0023591127|nr:hypothetical protein [Mycobacterium marinum]WCS17538.1 hypothetical protein MML61_22505 [Mycobacterium marinum]